jgi:hypothetical protein
MILGATMLILNPLSLGCAWPNAIPQDRQTVQISTEFAAIRIAAAEGGDDNIEENSGVEPREGAAGLMAISSKESLLSAVDNSLRAD